MTKKLFIYNDVKPISVERHGTWSVKLSHDWRFAADINSVPLLVSEFAQAARHYPIVFAGEGDQIMPIAVLGIRNAQNAFLAPDGDWIVPYVPAILRQYPYVFAQAKDAGQLILCLDETYAGFNTDGKGERLFDSDGERTQFLTSKLEFAKSYQAQFRAAQRFGQRLTELKLLEPMRAQFTLQGLPDETLTGFQSITRDALKNLPDEELLRMQRVGMLEAVYMQMFSIGNFDAIVKRLAGAGAA